MEEETQYQTIIHSIETGEFSVPLFQATLFGLLQREKGKYIIEALLRAETDISTRTSCSTTPEQTNIRNTHTNIVQLFANSAENHDFYDNKKRTVLHHASIFGWLEVVRSLLKKGADPNVKDIDSYTPVMLATGRSHKNVADLLIASGADVLCRRIDDYTLLHATSAAGWLDIVQFILNKGADPNAATIVGYTPLHLAACKSHKDVVDLLIKSGGDTACCNFQGRSVLHVAVERSTLEVVQCLVEKGADLSDRRFESSTPFFLACSYKKIDIIEYLVNAMNLKNGSSNTPLNYIIRLYPEPLLIRRFIKRGGYLNFIDYYRILRNPSLKEFVLQHTLICTQAIINKFNNKDLPDLYKLPMSVEILPPIKKFTITKASIVQDIQQSVRREIRTKGYCNLMKPKAILLRMTAVKSYLDYYDGLRKKSQMKRSAVVETDHQSGSPSKMPC